MWRSACLQHVVNFIQAAALTCWSRNQSSCPLMRKLRLLHLLLCACQLAHLHVILTRR